MGYLIGSASGHYDLLDQIRQFACGYGTLGTPSYSGTGDGTIGSLATHPATVTETWTIACTNAATPGAEVWSVTGSVSGAQASATTGVAYDNGLIAFTITAGATNFVVSDQWTIAATEGVLTTEGQAWIEERWNTSGDDHDLIMRGGGLSGTDQIYIGLKTYQDTNADYYNFKIDGFTGYSSGNTFEEQPGKSGPMGVPLFNQTLPFWLAVNGQRIICAAKVETVYEIFYLGFMYPYATPNQFPYPMVVGAPLDADDPTRYSDTTHTMAFRGNATNLKLRMPSGIWEQPKVWPFSNAQVNGGSTFLRDTGGIYPILPLKLWDDAPQNHYGELDGLMHISGFNNAVENTMTVGGDTYTVIHDAWRTGFNDYVAMRTA